MDDIEERLRSHAQAFNGLLSLIPAKYYYGEDGSDQWQRKKQTKEEAREAKRAKLDPDSAKTAKDVMDENARKRKREEAEQNGSGSSDAEELGSEIPKEGLSRGDANSKKQKQAENSERSDKTSAKSNEDAEARKKLKEEKLAQKKASQKEKKKAKETARKEKQAEQQKKDPKTPAAAEAVQKPEPTANGRKSSEQTAAQDSDDSDDEVDGEEAVAEGLSLEFNPDQTTEQSGSSSPNSPDFDTSNPQSGSSSISSIVPPSDPNDASKPSSTEPKPLKPTPEELKQRLQKRLDELRAKRHADGLDGKPARNRQELIEARRQKAEQRKAHKKELRQKAKEEEQRANDEAMARRFSPGGSGSLLASPRSPADSVGSNNNFSFGRVVFADGNMTDPTLANAREAHKRSGPTDPAAALKAAEAKKARLAGLDDEKRTDLEEKDMWLNAKKRAHGERVRDDTSLLKKALKRKESAKKKSEREWKDRLEAVKRGKDVKQQKREDNLRKRRDEKGSGGGGKNKKPAGGNKKKARPGFEGGPKGKIGGKKK